MILLKVLLFIFGCRLGAPSPVPASNVTVTSTIKNVTEVPVSTTSGSAQVKPFKSTTVEIVDFTNSGKHRVSESTVTVASTTKTVTKAPEPTTSESATNKLFTSTPLEILPFTSSEKSRDAVSSAARNTIKNVTEISAPTTTSTLKQFNSSTVHVVPISTLEKTTEDVATIAATRATSKNTSEKIQVPTTISAEKEYFHSSTMGTVAFASSQKTNLDIATVAVKKTPSKNGVNTPTTAGSPIEEKFTSTTARTVPFVTIQTKNAGDVTGIAINTAKKHVTQDTTVPTPTKKEQDERFNSISVKIAKIATTGKTHLVYGFMVDQNDATIVTANDTTKTVTDVPATTDTISAVSEQFDKTIAETGLFPATSQKTNEKAFITAAVTPSTQSVRRRVLTPAIHDPRPNAYLLLGAYRLPGCSFSQNFAFQRIHEAFYNCSNTKNVDFRRCINRNGTAVQQVKNAVTRWHKHLYDCLGKPIPNIEARNESDSHSSYGNDPFNAIQCFTDIGFLMGVAVKGIRSQCSLEFKKCWNATTADRAEAGKLGHAFVATFAQCIFEAQMKGSFWYPEEEWKTW
jgi:hypothetical protein